MARNISPTSLSVIATKKGIEPITIVAINWGNTGTLFYYSDRKVPEEPGLGGKLLSISNIDSVIDITGSTASNTVSIALDDTDGVLKNIFNNVDVHKNQVIVYQWFSGIPLSDAFIIFEGVVTSPIVWKEGDRELSFEVISRLEDNEVGFSPDDGDFTNVPQELVNQAWPLIFGTAINVKPVQIDNIPTGNTLEPLGITDPGLTQGSISVDCSIGKQLAIASCLSRFGAKLQFEGDLGGAGREVYDKGSQFQQRAQDIIRQVATQSAKDRGRFSGIKAQQQNFDKNAFQVLNGNRFLQGQQIGLKIGKLRYVGTMNGTLFTVKSRRVENDPYSQAPPGTSSSDAGGGGGSSQNVPIEDPQTDFLEDALFGNVDPETLISSSAQERKEDPCGPHNLILPDCGNGSSSTRTGAANFFGAEKKDFAFEQAGSAVTVADTYPVRYVVSIVPGTQVVAVASYIRDGGVKRLVTIPSSYYSVSTQIFGSITATIVTVTAPFSTIEGSIFEDDIYVTVTSPIGPNIVDIIQYLIETYASNLIIDATSFASVHADLVPYPANFALSEKKNIVEILKEIAFQGMCALWVSNNIVYLKFLPKQGPIIETFTEDDVESKTLEITCEPTENIVTKFIAEWKQDYAASANNKLILKANVAKYGVHEQTYNFYIYNNEESVKIAATFWLIRRANTFKILKFKTFLHKLKVETLDDVQLNFANNYVANSNVPAVVQNADFDSSDMSITLQLWVPVRFGEMVLYNNALPVTYQDIYPTHTDELTGNAGSIGPSADSGGDLSGGASNAVNFNIVRTNKSKGSTRPADPNFQAPTNAQIYTTVAPPGTSGGGGTQIKPEPKPPQVYFFDLRHAANLPRPRVTSNNATFPGRVLGFSGTDDNGDQQYNVRAWPNGFQNAPVEMKVTQLFMDENDEIPADTWVIVSQQFIVTDKGQGNEPDIKIYNAMQVPIWL